MQGDVLARCLPINVGNFVLFDRSVVFFNTNDDCERQSGCCNPHHDCGQHQDVGQRIRIRHALHILTTDCIYGKNWCRSALHLSHGHIEHNHGDLEDIEAHHLLHQVIAGHHDVEPNDHQ